MNITDIIDVDKLQQELTIENRLQTLQKIALQKQVKEALIWMDGVMPNTMTDEEATYTEKGILIFVKNLSSLDFRHGMRIGVYTYHSVMDIQILDRLRSQSLDQITFPALFLLQEYMDGQAVSPILKVNRFLLSCLSRYRPYLTYPSPYRLQYIFADTQLPYKERLPLFPILTGYGDLFLVLPILHDLYKHHQIRGVVMVHPSMTATARQLLVQGTEVYAVDFATLYHLVVYAIEQKQAYYAGLLIPLSVKPEEAYYIFEDMITHLTQRGCIHNTPSQIYHTFLNSPPYLSQPNSRLRISHHYTKVIGFQRLSGTKGMYRRALKEIPPAFAEQFIARCEKHGIAVINCSPDEPLRYMYTADISDLSMEQLLFYVPLFDMMVGVDSSFTQMCTIFKKKGMTLYCTTSANYMSQSVKSIPVAYNFSIFPRNFDLHELNLDSIWSVFLRLMDNRLDVDSHYTPLVEKRNYIHYIISRSVETEK